MALGRIGTDEHSGRSPRSARLFSAEITLAGGAKQRIMVKDISERGCGARADSTPPVGTRISLMLPGVGDVEGSVAWAGKGRFGIHFDAPITVAAVIRDPRPSNEFVVSDMHKTARDGRRPGFGPKTT